MMKSRMNLAYAMIAILLVGGLFSACPTDPPAVQPTGTLYTVTVEQPAVGGTIDADPKSAEEGAVITLTAEPDLGYVLSSYTVATEGGDAIDLEDGTGDVRTFIMPAADVKVSGNFRGENDIDHDVNITQSAGGTFTVSPEKAYVGDTVTLTATPDSNKALDTVTVTKAGGGTVTVTGTGNTRTFEMPDEEVTITVTWKELGDVNNPIVISSGAIVIPAPVAGEPALEADETNYADVGANFTAIITAVTGDLDAGNYKGSTSYIFTFELVPISLGYKFGTGATNITVNGKAGEYVYLDEQVAELKCTFGTGLVAGNPNDWAYGRTGAADSVSQWNLTAVANNAFDGNNSTTGVLGVNGNTNSVWQAEGTIMPHWLAVDLGQERDIGSVRITWGSATNDGVNVMDLMVAGDIQIGTALPLPTTYEDTGWTKVGEFKNIARGDQEGAIGPPGGSWQNPQVQVVAVDPGTKGRYLRVKMTEPLENMTGGGAWTQWPRICTLEVYEGGPPEFQTIEQKPLTVKTPSLGASLPVGNIADAAANFTVTVTDVSPALIDNKFAFNVAYTYTLVFETKPGFRFTIKAPNVNGTDTVVAPGDNEFGYKITTKHTFGPSGAQILGNITVPVPAVGGDVPALNAGDYADEGADFSAQISAISPTVGATYTGGAAYELEFTLTAKGSFTFQNSTQVTVSVNGNDATYTYVNATTATATYEFPMLPWPILPTNVNIAAGKVASASTVSGYNTTAIPSNIVDGDRISVWQAKGDGNATTKAHWVGVNLGSQFNIGTVRLRFPDAQSDAFHTAEVQYRNTAPASWVSIYPGVPSFDDTGWTRSVQFHVPTAATKVYTITMPAGISAQWVRVKVVAPLTTGDGCYTEWPRVSELEIFEGGPNSEN